MEGKKILIFGAGKIGRSFIGQLFGRNGFKVLFVDKDHMIVKALNERGTYSIAVKSAATDQRMAIKNISAIDISNTAEVREAIRETDIMAVSVGKTALQEIASVIAHGLIDRAERYPGKVLDIILAENMRSTDLYFRDLLRKHLPSSYPLEDLVGLVETSIGKMVPIMKTEDLKEDPLLVFAEPYNTLILDRKGFLGEIPHIKEFALKDNIKAWVDRKAFIHNLGHAAAAYYGHYMLPDSLYMHEVLADKRVIKYTRQVMEEAGELLRAIYPDEFTNDDITDHINDLLYRFQNRDLGDTIFRVGSDLQRKLGPDDRFMATIRLAKEKKVPYSMILDAMAIGFYFRAKDENGHMFPGDVDFHKWVSDNRDAVFEQICGLHPSSDFLLISQLKKQIDKHSQHND